MIFTSGRSNNKRRNERYPRGNCKLKHDDCMHVINSNLWLFSGYFQLGSCSICYDIVDICEKKRNCQSGSCMSDQTNKCLQGSHFHLSNFCITRGCLVTQYQSSYAVSVLLLAFLVWCRHADLVSKMIGPFTILSPDQ